MSTSVVLILGTGPNVGLSIATKFAAKGWKVAAVSRSPKDDIKKAAHQVIAADFSDPHGISNIFEEVKTKLGIPNVVIYNGTNTCLTCHLTIVIHLQHAKLRRLCCNRLI